MKTIVLSISLFVSFSFAKDFVPFLSFSSSQSALIKIYSQHRVLPLSGLGYDFSDQGCSVDGFVRIKGEEEKVLWRLLIPEEVFGKEMSCMDEKLCFSSFSKRLYKGSMCCRKRSQSFRKMSSDMHHIIPTVNKEYAKNLLKLNDVADKGMIARAVLYMYESYKIDFDTILLEKYQLWNQKYPVSAWEMKRNQKIFELQGTFNPYIEKL